MKELNKSFKERDLIIFGTPKQDYSIGGCIRFADLSVTKLQELVLKNFADLEDCQNDAPTLKEFLNFGLKYPQIKFIGYVVSPERNDYRVTIEGIDFKGKTTPDMITDFINLCRDADDFITSETELYCWYD